MNEAQQTATLATMTDKELKTLVKRLDAQVTDLKYSIAEFESMITVAGAQACIDRISANSEAAGYGFTLGAKTAPELAAWWSAWAGKRYGIHQAKLITKTRRLVQAAGEMARRLEAANV